MLYSHSRPYSWAEASSVSMGKEKGGKKGGGASKPEHMSDEEWELCQNVAELVMVRRFNPVLRQRARLRAVRSSTHTHVTCVSLGMGGQLRYSLDTPVWLRQMGCNWGAESARP